MTQINQTDIESVAEKLETFAQGLGEDERAVLGYILARAESADESDVEGFASQFASRNFSQMESFGSLKAGLPSQLGRSTGFPGGNAADITISWSW